MIYVVRFRIWNGAVGKFIPFPGKDFWHTSVKTFGKLWISLCFESFLGRWNYITRQAVRDKDPASMVFNILGRNLSYSISEMLSNGWWSHNVYNIVDIFNFLLNVFVSGQIVTVGNGIIDIFAGLSAKPKVIGFSCQSAKIFFIDEPQKNADRPNANIHQTLF